MTNKGEFTIREVAEVDDINFADYALGEAAQAVGSSSRSRARLQQWLLELVELRAFQDSVERASAGYKILMGGG